MKNIIYIVLMMILITENSEARQNGQNQYGLHPKPYVAQNGTRMSQINPKTYKPKSQYVRQYNHKDGSRVRSYYRTKPGR